jgi:hypothetical protein
MAGKLQEDLNRNYEILMQCTTETDVNRAEFLSAVRVSKVVHFRTFNELAVIHINYFLCAFVEFTFSSTDVN